MIADMHTHSEYSHDSVCKIEDMCRAQAEQGIDIFAVTDHFDTASHMDYDVFSPIKNACDTVMTLRQSRQDGPLILSGVEISEGFWYPEAYQKVMGLADYDVVIGSVHLVQYEGLRMSYSTIDFSKLDHEVIVQYLDAYFDDMLTMLDTLDFDILAHLTCPLRYIVGKYGFTVDMTRYADKITAILRTVIEQGKALEVNTSCFASMGVWLPSTDILQQYYDMGGRLITVGSDAHVAENAAKHIPEAIAMLKEIGFESIYYYQERKAHPIEI